MNEELRTHYKVINKLHDLDRLRPKVALAFIMFWSCLAIAFVATILYYWVF